MAWGGTAQDLMRAQTPPKGRSTIDASQSISSTFFRSGPSMTHYLRSSFRPASPKRSEWHRPGQMVDDDLRKKLLDISSSFTTLGKQVDDDARRRRELELRNCQELVTFIGKLEHEIVEETHARESDMQHLKEGVEERVANMVTAVETRLSERFTHLVDTIEALTNRCVNLELGIQQFKGEVPSQLQVEMVTLKEEMASLLDEFKREQRHSLTQEESFAHRLEEGGLNVDSEMHKELARIERRGEALQELIDQFTFGSEVVEKRAAILDQIAQLRRELEMEVGERQAADDEVIEAINDYRATLLRSLNTASTA